jgi:hypothetical protein
MEEIDNFDLFNFHNRTVTIGIILDVSNVHVGNNKLKNIVKDAAVNQLKKIKIQGNYCINGNITRNLGEVIGEISNYEEPWILDKNILKDINLHEGDKILLIFSNQTEKNANYYKKLERQNTQKNYQIQINTLDLDNLEQILLDILKKYYE